ncbi:hypothetical protein BDV36DRAFT_284467 [Aspergillus pseudocaelatus]|uniref:Fatty acid hydroxylase domain-containing protein n=1 Tax=Aspergillus pseudocaelatus TaxID=1825620 RepID=A0ABQ6WHF3_9EURO|nr:hypothetical protein BDV36DRAFT_284467 [Aspergillus pseudocaelatus]
MPIFFKRMKEYTYEKLNPNEIPKSSKTTFNWQIGLPWILLDVFHSLHCLNYIRMYVDKDYYSTHLEHHDSFLKNSSHIPDDWGQVHLHHCLDQVVQSVICHADLSPVPMYGWKGVPVFLGVGQTHTCRRWDHIREWMDARNEVYEPLEEE